MKYNFRLFMILVILLLALSSCQLGVSKKESTQTAIYSETETALSGISPTSMVQIVSPTETKSVSTAPTDRPEPTMPDAQAATPLHTPTPKLEPTVIDKAPTQAPTGLQTLPLIYKLHRGEFPWCIARRYDLDPREVMSLNGFTYSQIFYPGQEIKLPQTGNPFPWKRALNKHPAIYVVRPGDTIYKVACFYGDIDPLAIAQVNGLIAPYKIQAGQKLKIPGEGFLLGDGASAPSFAQQPTTVPNTLPPPTLTPTLEQTPIPTVTPTLAPSPTPIPTDVPSPTVVPLKSATLAIEPVVVISPNVAIDSEQKQRLYYNSISLISLDPLIVSKPQNSEIASLDELVGFFETVSPSAVIGCPSSHDFYHSPEHPELHQVVELISCGWNQGEQVQVTIKSPADEIVHSAVETAQLHQNSPDIALVNIRYFSVIQDLAGVYTVDFHSMSRDRNIRHSFELISPQGPRVDVVVHDIPGFLLYKFQPGENVKIKVFRRSEEDPLIWIYLGFKDIVVDSHGCLRVQMMTNRLDLYGFQFIGNTSGKAYPTQ